ncbi:MAG TPA: glycosyltransferase [Vicinamibacterales bacterium]|nr:glycosyltransferase [Vicinamibacterales bacterium]
MVHVTAYFAPAFGFGGPPHSILALCQALPSVGVDVEVFTTTANVGGELDAHVGGTSYEGVATRYFPLRSPRFLLAGRGLPTALMTAAADADLIHLHGLFNATSWAAARVARRANLPVVLSARGMLEPAAVAHHRMRKRAAWRLFDRRTVRDAALIHTTSPGEQQTIVASWPEKPIVQIPNPVAMRADPIGPREQSDLRERLAIPRDRRIALFLGRLHPIKRLDLLARAFEQVAASMPDLDVVIAGEAPGFDRRPIIAAAGDAASRVRWVGAVYGRERDVLLSTASALVLCSDSENFGMSVAEALAAGVAPVVTQTCPWSVLQEEAVGYWVPQTAAAIAAGLTAALQAAPDMTLRQRRQAVAHRLFAGDVIAHQWRATYDAVLSGAR